MSFNLFLVLSLVVQLVFAGAPSVCGNTGVTTLEGKGGHQASCDYRYLCKLSCPCVEYVRMVDVQTTSGYSSYSTAWETQCSKRNVHNRCTCEEFYSSIGIPAKDLNYFKNLICKCPKSKLKTSIRSVSSNTNRAATLEGRASDLEQKALELESQAESLELE
jgi:hypothetical protein